MSKRLLFFQGAHLSDKWISDRWRFLFHALIDRLGFKHYHDKNEISGGDIILAIAPPTQLIRWNNEGYFDNRNAKFIIHTHNYYLKLLSQKNKKKLARMRDVIKKCHLHLSSGDVAFKRVFPEYIDKHVFFPYFFAPQKRYLDLKFNEAPTMKCLFMGARNNNYPLRKAVFRFVKSQEKNSAIIKLIKYPGTLGYKNCPDLVGDNFAVLLNQHFCQITSNVFGHPVAKHFEVMASGSLLLSDETKDLKTLGMIAGKHYVAVTGENFAEKIRHCLTHPSDYRQIRINGMKYSRANHGIENRLSTIGGIIKKLEV